jgi:DNA-binding transcriptional MerR regulator
MPQRDLVKLYYRIGEVSDIVGVQPHVLRYWETEFRSIRPQKSSKGQRVYSRRDVEKLLKVKDLLKNQGFTIAGARKRLSEPSAREGVVREDATREEAVREAVVREAVVREAVVREAVPAELPIPVESRAKNMRQALLGIRQDIVRLLEEMTASNVERPLP